MSRRTLAWAAGLVMALPGPVPAQTLPPGNAEAAGFSAERLRALHDTLAALVERGVIPGAVVLVARGGRVVDVSAVGQADRVAGTRLARNAIFRLASATKIWVSVAFMTLVEEGRVGLDEPLARYLPEFGAPRVFRDSATVGAATGRITVRDLLRHTAGLGYGFTDPYQSALAASGLITLGGRFAMEWTHPWTLEEWSRRLAAVPLETEPRTRFSYGLTHDVLGRLSPGSAGGVGAGDAGQPAHRNRDRRQLLARRRLRFRCRRPVR